ncbi:substrate-binding domain-containing protein [Pseudomonas huanghezhanensis]|uniref:substrate-binding domain-containing protein n=1 Tax=Pseudomonas huanghezhanensis TaxID=3002903 RepID=UPI0022860D36|nr:substrate-binding domain-containing protein [Pseudomonas sp. BSw22131]
MFKRTLIAASMAVAALASAQSMAAVTGGGATLPLPLYTTAGVLSSGFDTYTGGGSGAGKTAFLTNTPSAIGKTANVDFAGSDSVLTAAELSTYASAHNAAWGPLIQVPSVGTSVAVPFNKAGATAVNLTTAQLCGVFAGTITNWSQIANSGSAAPITVVYRAESSGTTELFTRYLNSRCGSSVPGTFAVTTTFSGSYSGGLPSNFTPATGSDGVSAALKVADGRITYLSPDWAATSEAGLADTAKVAQINGASPSTANVSAAVATVSAPATAAERAVPANWARTFGTGGIAYPTSGYPIIGFTNLIFSQCYADSTDTSQVLDFLNRHYGVSTGTNNDASIKANRFVPMSDTFKAAVRSSFTSSLSSLSVGRSNVCNGIGRPM